eukprot:91222-Prorocentrum_lima.AAC.1
MWERPVLSWRARFWERVSWAWRNHVWNAREDCSMTCARSDAVSTVVCTGVVGAGGLDSTTT